MIILNFSRTLCSRARKKRRNYSLGVLKKLFIRILIIMWIATNCFTSGQGELSYLDLLYPHKFHHVIRSELPADPYERIRSMAKRAKVTVEGLDQDRILTVFRASRVGHIEFGFPGQTNRAAGSMEVVDVSRMFTRCCLSGERMVALRHSCSNAYLTLDDYAQMRACVIGEGTTTKMRSSTHCIDGEKLHSCQSSPYLFLDPAERFREMGPLGATPNLYKLRFEVKRNRRAKFNQIYYVQVMPATWKIKLRPQKSVIRRSAFTAAHRLWVTSLHALFRRSVDSFEGRGRSSQSTRRSRGCFVDPAVVRDNVIANASSSQFEHFVNLMWREQERNADYFASSVAWTRMPPSKKKLFVMIVIKAVKRMLRDSLVDITRWYCLKKSAWGKINRNDRLLYLERSLTNTLLQKKVEAMRLVLIALENSMDSKLTTFLITEDG